MTRSHISQADLILANQREAIERAEQPKHFGLPPSGFQVPRQMEVIVTSQTWIAPSAAQIRLEVVGGGGGGGVCGEIGGGGGGGAGATVIAEVNLEGGDELVIVIGAGGAGGVTRTGPTDGGNTTIACGDKLTMTAGGGGHGGNAGAIVADAGGLGGDGSGLQACFGSSLIGSAIYRDGAPGGDGGVGASSTIFIHGGGPRGRGGAGEGYATIGLPGSRPGSGGDGGRWAGMIHPGVSGNAGCVVIYY